MTSLPDELRRIASREYELPAPSPPSPPATGCGEALRDLQHWMSAAMAMPDADRLDWLKSFCEAWELRIRATLGDK